MGEPSRTETPRDERLLRSAERLRTVLGQLEASREAVGELTSPIEVGMRWDRRGPWFAEFAWRGNRVTVQGWSPTRTWIRAIVVRASMSRSDPRLAVPAREPQPTVKTHFTEAEREVWTPPTCPRCDGEIRIDWCDTTTLHDLTDGIRWYVIADMRCRTTGCADDVGSKRIPLSVLAESECIEGAWRG